MTKKRNRVTLAERVAIATSILAVVIAAFPLVRDAYSEQHVLNASVIGIDGPDGGYQARILLVNKGRSHEVLYAARLIFESDLSSINGNLSKERVGPLVVSPGAAKLLTIDVSAKELPWMEADGTLLDGLDSARVGVNFVVVTPKGVVEERDSTHWFQEINFDADQEDGGTDEFDGADSGFIELL